MNYLRKFALTLSGIAMLCMPAFSQGTGLLTGITVYPQGMFYIGDADVDSLQVIATYSDGSTQDVSANATITNDSYNPAALGIAADPSGLFSNVSKNPSATDPYNPAPLMITATYGGFSSSTLVIREAGGQVGGNGVNEQGGADLGFPSFSTNQGGPIDHFDLATDVVNINIPIRSKAGLIPFTYQLNGTSSLFAGPKPPPGGFIWDTSFGLTGASNIDKHIAGTLKSEGGGIGIFQGIRIMDEYGTTHWLYTSQTSGTLLTIVCSYGKCPATTGYTEDNTGYVANVVPYSVGYGTIYDRSGNSYALSVVNGNYVQTMTDPNGNKIYYTETTNSSGWTKTYTDTLGQTVMTTTANLAPGSSVSYSFAGGGSTGTQTYTLNYGSKLLVTNFNCSNVTDDAGNQVYLPTSVTLPPAVGGSYSFTYQANGSGVDGRMQTLTLPTGGTVKYTYSAMNCTDDVTQAAITRKVTDNVTGTTGTWTYNTTPISGTTSSNTDIVERPDGYYSKYSFSNGFKYDFQTCTTSSCNDASPALHTYVCYNLHFGGQCGPSNAITYPITATDVYNSPDGLSPSVVQDMFDSYGMTVEEFLYSWSSVKISQRNTPTGTYNASTGACTAPNANIHDRNCFNNLYQANGTTPVTSTWHTYDQYGNLTETANWTGATENTDLTTLYQYNSNGTVKQVTDPNGSVTKYTYGDCSVNGQGAMLTLIQYPVNSLQESFIWDNGDACIGGVLTNHTEVSGSSVSTAYNDPLWRRSSATDENGQITDFSYTLNSSTGTETFGSSTVTHVSTLDGFGASILEQKYNGSNYDTVETDYDSSRRIAKVSIPFASALGTRSSTIAGTTTSYDYTGRPYISTDPNGATVTQTYYQGDVKIAEGPSGKTIQSEYDGLGRLTTGCNISGQTGKSSCGERSGSGTQGFPATYLYREDGALLSTTQGSQTRTFTYDALGRMLTSTTPEKGLIEYAYDSYSGCETSNGDLVESQTANDRALTGYTCYAYDNLHRMTLIFPYLSIPSDFIYDSSTVDGVSVGQPGRLAEAYTQFVLQSRKTDEGFQYDSRGNVSKYFQTSPNSGGWYTSTASYDPLGNISLMSMSPSVLPSISTTLDGAGRIAKVSSGNGQNPVTAISYGPVGVGAVTYGSGDSDSFSYTNGRLSKVTSGIGSTNYFSTPTYNTNGTLKNTVTATGAQVNYGYDDMARLTSASDGVSIQQTYTYDQYGNLSTSGSPYSFLPTYTSNNQIQMTGVTYDADGNMLTDLDHTYTWDANDKVSSIDGNTITRDAFGRMVENAANGEEFFYGHFGHTVMRGQTLVFTQTDLTGGGKILIEPSVTYLLRPDWQGNAALISSWGQTIVGNSAEYSPFGQLYNSPDWGVFNGGTSNADMGTFLWDTPNRELHGKEGRWISPDPSGMKAASLADPQSLNMYAFASNNPLSFSDPSGLDDDDGTGGEYNGSFGGTCLMCGTSNYGQLLVKQAMSFFGRSYLDLPVGNSLGNNGTIEEFYYLQNIAPSLYGSNSSVTLGANGVAITFAVSYWGKWVGSCPDDTFCNDNLVYNLFQFTEPGSGKTFTFDTSLSNTVVAFQRAGITPSSLDNNYNIAHPAGSFHLRDSRQLCSVHVILDPGSGQTTTGGVHIDSINPNFSIAGHIIQDLIPDKLNRFGVPAGGAACQ